ncbi:UbiA family prenyltransferase [Streptomyces zagrosensis]|uniref:1,4-dihydroxy-2-naphthoate octaprenyltransferase n=1 Tax=Streptomyces zagrosensis TaxID=1042984 RepID=A0A7W9UZF1_9ACTN|nr:UbiA family prenyltransferase [Streptomyces zagrosensis]MBB5936975.1 1,4-dihydroxy-2-naphthoate octaprenyltransferase [Streptomyces zagrosensis]
MSLNIAASPDTRDRLNAYIKLGKLGFYDYYLSAFIVWAALPGSQLWDGTTFAVLLLYIAGYVGVVAATVALDDVTGIRDGSDAHNYSPETGALRDLTRKPLLSGALTVRQAELFGWGAMVWGAILWSMVFVIAPETSLWVGLLMAAVLISNVQYSYGMKISYNFGQELILVTPGLAILVPYVLLTGEATGLVILETVLFGLWSLLVSIYSNMNDVEGDRLAGRRNLATLTSPSAYRKIIVGAHLLELIAVAVAIGVGAVPLWFVALMVPLWVMRVSQARAGVGQGNLLQARMLGIKLHRWGVPALLLANVLALHV